MDYASTASLKGRVAVVTGGTGGIGLESSKALQEHGATVVICGIDVDRGEKAARELGLEFWPVDVTRSADVANLARHVQDKYGRLDVAFNNAGIAHTVPSEGCTDEEWLNVINVNLNGVFYCCREFGKLMLAQGQGSIINTASMSGLVSNHPQPQCAYNAAKADVIMLTKSLAGEWARRGGSRQQRLPRVHQHPDDAEGSGKGRLVQRLDDVLADGPNRRAPGDCPGRGLSCFGCEQFCHREQPRD